MEKKEECGLFGVFNNKDAAVITSMGLLALQHRGEESAGIAVTDGTDMNLHARLGHVSRVFDTARLNNLRGNCAIGHTRYSVTGNSNDKNVQPLLVDIARGKIAIAHNGNLTNSKDLKKRLESEGSIFQTTMDSEIVLHLIARSRAESFKDAIIEAVRQLQGAFSLLFLTRDALFAVRDAHGVRPLCLGTLGDSTILCSETSAIDLVDAKYMGQIDPGEIITVTAQGIERESIFPQVKQASCIFEMIYFARPDSLVFGESVYKFRKELGRILAEESPVDADMIVPVPDSGVCAALGYAEQSGIPFEMALTRNHYVGRSFIQPEPHLRKSFVRMKLNPIKNLINKKRIVIVDDSIVRGTTTRERVRTLRESGAKEVHMRISCPPILHGCFYGVDFPDRSELISVRMSTEEVRTYLNLDSLAFISHEGMLRAHKGCNTFCDACFSGAYPIPIEKDFNKESLSCR